MTPEELRDACATYRAELFGFVLEHAGARTWMDRSCWLACAEWSAARVAELEPAKDRTWS